MANVLNDTVGEDLATTVYASEARTATPDTMEYDVSSARGLVLITDLTAFATTASLTVKVEGVDRVSGKVWTLIAGAALAATGTQILQVAPGLPVTANQSANALLPSFVRITATHGNGNSHTYSVAMHLVS